jgi:GNAT superfamily N-acetyltransferase
VSPESGARDAAAPRVRPAARADAEPIAELAVRSWREGFRGIVPDEIDPEAAWRPDRIEARLEGRLDDGTRILVAERGGRVAGFVLDGPCRDDDAVPGTGEVWALYVDPDHWRAGVGRALVEASLARLRADGFGEVTVWTLAESPRNLRFYEALGFRPDGAEQRRESFGAPLEVRLRRALGARG